MQFIHHSSLPLCFEALLEHAPNTSQEHFNPNSHTHPILHQEHKKHLNLFTTSETSVNNEPRKNPWDLPSFLQEELSRRQLQGLAPYTNRPTPSRRPPLPTPLQDSLKFTLSSHLVQQDTLEFIQKRCENWVQSQSLRRLIRPTNDNPHGNIGSEAYEVAQIRTLARLAQEEADRIELEEMRLARLAQEGADDIEAMERLESVLDQLAENIDALGMQMEEYHRLATLNGDRVLLPEWVYMELDTFVPDPEPEPKPEFFSATATAPTPTSSSTSTATPAPAPAPATTTNIPTSTGLRGGGVLGDITTTYSSNQTNIHHGRQAAGRSTATVREQVFQRRQVVQIRRSHNQRGDRRVFGRLPGLPAPNARARGGANTGADTGIDANTVEIIPEFTSDADREGWLMTRRVLGGDQDPALALWRMERRRLAMAENQPPPRPVEVREELRGYFD